MKEVRSRMEYLGFVAALSKMERGADILSGNSEFYPGWWAFYDDGEKAIKDIDYDAAKAAALRELATECITSDHANIRMHIAIKESCNEWIENNKLDFSKHSEE